MEYVDWIFIYNNYSDDARVSTRLLPPKYYRNSFYKKSRSCDFYILDIVLSVCSGLLCKNHSKKKARRKDHFRIKFEAVEWGLNFCGFREAQKKEIKKKKWRWRNYCWLLLQLLWLRLQFSRARRKVRGILISEFLSHLQFCFSHLQTNAAFLLFPFRFEYNQDKTNDQAVKTRELLQCALICAMHVIFHLVVKL